MTSQTGPGAEQPTALEHEHDPDIAVIPSERAVAAEPAAGDSAMAPDPKIAAVESVADDLVEPVPSPLARLLRSSSIWTAGVLALFIVVFSTLMPRSFASSGNASTVLSNAAILLVLAVGMTFVIITSGIDLSVGAVLVLSAVVAGQQMAKVGETGTAVVLVGLVVAVLTGLLLGAINGVVIAYAKVPPLIVTLGMLGVALGSARILTKGIDIRTDAMENIDTPKGEILGIRPIVLVALGVLIVGALVLHLTRFGRYTYAIGSNAEAARRSGVNVRMHLVKVYALSGLLAGFAGFLSLGKYGTTGIGGHDADNLNAIAAVVLGGTSLFGGIGTIIGTLIGVFIPAVLANGFVLLGIQTYWQQVAVGVVLVAAVWFDQYKRRSRNRS
jgi:ribose transport system permease protein